MKIWRSSSVSVGIGIECFSALRMISLSFTSNRRCCAGSQREGLYEELLSS
jgi:hypothetical protein